MSQKEFYEDDVLQRAYTAKKLLDLSYLIQSQVTEVYARKGLIFPVSCSSTLLRIHRSGPASVTELARALAHPHQTVAQHLNTLSGLKIIERRPDETDRRRVAYTLTDVGKEQAAILEDYNLEAAKVFEELNSDIGTDLGRTLDQCTRALFRSSMADRFWDLFEQGNDQ